MGRHIKLALLVLPGGGKPKPYSGRLALGCRNVTTLPTANRQLIACSSSPGELIDAR